MFVSKKKAEEYLVVCGCNILNELLNQVILRFKSYCNWYFGELSTNNHII